MKMTNFTLAWCEHCCHGDKQWKKFQIKHFQLKRTKHKIKWITRTIGWLWRVQYLICGLEVFSGRITLSGTHWAQLFSPGWFLWLCWIGSTFQLVWMLSDPFAIYKMMPIQCNNPRKMSRANCDALLVFSQLESLHVTHRWRNLRFVFGMSTGVSMFKN